MIRELVPSPYKSSNLVTESSMRQGNPSKISIGEETGLVTQSLQIGFKMPGNDS